MVTKHAGIILQHVRKILSAHEIEQLCDRDLLRRFIQERDEVAFATLVRRHGRMVLQSCQRVLHNQHDAEDGFQATFLVLARKAASRRWKESVGPWLYLVAYRLALKIRAGRDRQLPRNPRPVERASEDPLAVASSHELGSVLDEELRRLPEKCRAPLVLCSLNGLSRDEAARQLGWSLGTFRRRLEQGRALLRQPLRKPLSRRRRKRPWDAWQGSLLAGHKGKARERVGCKGSLSDSLRDRGARSPLRRILRSGKHEESELSAQSAAGNPVIPPAEKPPPAAPPIAPAPG